MKALRLREHFATSPLHSAKVWVTMGLISLALIVIGYRFGDRLGLLLGFTLALAVNALVVFYTDLRLARLFPSQELEGTDPWGLLASTRELASVMKVPRPTVHLLDLPTPLAFSAGMLTSRTTLYLSEELTRRLSREELRAVVAYELARLKNKDVRATTAGAALASVFVALAFAIDETLFLGFLRRLRLPLAERRRWLPGPMIYLLSPLIIGILRLATNRSAVFTADEDAASAIGDPQTLAQTLWKLDAYLHARPLTTVGPADANLFLVNPICALPSLRLFNVLPSVKQRITRLVGHYPL